MLFLEAILDRLELHEEKKRASINPSPPPKKKHHGNYPKA